MKIGILGTRGIPNNYGGFEQFAHILAEGLTEKGCDVTVYNSHNHPYQHKKLEKINIVHKYDPEYNNSGNELFFASDKTGKFKLYFVVKNNAGAWNQAVSIDNINNYKGRWSFL